ncbi:MAG: hypothetical protein HY909_17165 [Deltaproteobacteria bacterium]|nr:hypothetical protein [Deltaproteobacteria bacterium]
MTKHLLTLALALAPGAAFAQPWQAPPPPPDPSAPPPPPQAASSELVVQQPDGSVSSVQSARDLQYNLVFGPEPVSSGGRLELSVTQGLNGMGIGLSLAALSGSRSPGVYAGASILGGGLGLATALVLTRDGITEGQSSAINMGTLYGGLGALFLSFGIADGLSVQAVGGIFAAGLTLGTVGGIVASFQRPLAGRVQFAGSLGVWSSFVSAHLFLATQGYGSFSRDDSAGAVRVFGLTSFGTLGAGLLAGALLAPNVNVTASRMRFINLAAVGGATVVGLSSMLFALESRDENALLTAYGIGAIAGAVGGAALGYLLTNRHDEFWFQQRQGQVASRRGFELNLLPGGPNGTPGLSLGGTF